MARHLRRPGFSQKTLLKGYLKAARYNSTGPFLWYGQSFRATGSNSQYSLLLPQTGLRAQLTGMPPAKGENGQRIYDPKTFKRVMLGTAQENYQ